MERNIKLNSLLNTFAELYWLKPVDIVWDAVNAYHISESINDDQVVLDLGCGDGLYSALMFGGELPINYDRFVNVIEKNQSIKENQFGDIYSNPFEIEKLKKMPNRRINYGLELKEHHLKVAKSLDIYDELFQGRMEDIPLENESVDLVYSIFAFYWGDDLERQMQEVSRVLRNDGTFLVNIPSEYLHDMHLCKKMSYDDNISDAMKHFYENMDGGRRALTTRYSRSKEEWVNYFDEHGFEVNEIVPIVNEVMFTLQDISQRPFLPSLFKLSNSKDFQEHRPSVKRYMCDTFNQDIIDYCLPHENSEDVRHGYYLVKATMK